MVVSLDVVELWKNLSLEYSSEMAHIYDYRGLSFIALEILNKMPKPIAELCGPISSGGLGNVAKNLEVFKKTSFKLMTMGYTIFDPSIFEKQLGYIRETYYKIPSEESNIILLEGFYEPIFESGLIEKAFFISGWESSQGASWEHNLTGKLGIPRVYLPKNFLEDNDGKKIN